MAFIYFQFPVIINMAAKGDISANNLVPVIVNIQLFEIGLTQSWQEQSIYIVLDALAKIQACKGSIQLLTGWLSGKHGSLMFPGEGFFFLFLL